MDNSVGAGIYYYRLKHIDFSGHYEYSNEIEVEVIGTFTFALDQNYPNPFNPSTTIEYSISETEFVSLKLFDVLGNEVAILVDEEKSAATYRVNFTAEELTSGIYFYVLKAGDYLNSKKLILLK